MKLHEVINLLEDRISFVKQTLSDKLSVKLKQDKIDQTPNQFVDWVSQYDPSAKKIYTQWLVTQYLNGTRAEDLYKSKEDLAKFDKIKSQLAKKDITQYNTRSLYATISKADPKQSGKQQKQQIKTEGADVVLRGSDATILKLKTKEAACYYGRGTRWCTAATKSENAFDVYNEEGPLYVAMCADGRKFQFHAESSQFMDENDEDIDVKQIRKQYPTINKLFVQIIEPVIMKDPISAFWYAMNAIKGRWPEAEPYILKDPISAFWYAKEVIKGRWREAEPAIMKDPEWGYMYRSVINEKLSQLS